MVIFHINQRKNVNHLIDDILDGFGKASNLTQQEKNTFGKNVRKSFNEDNVLTQKEVKEAYIDLLVDVFDRDK